MTDYDPQRHPHLAPGYYDQPADMAARPVTITQPNTPLTSTRGNAPLTSTPEVRMRTTITEPPQGEKPDDGPTMRSGRALEEMTVVQLRERAAARGVKWRGLNKAKLIEALRR